jgi:hypothetical protein
MIFDVRLAPGASSLARTQGCRAHPHMRLTLRDFSEEFVP